MRLQGIAKWYNWNSFVSNRPYIVHKSVLFKLYLSIKCIYQNFNFKKCFQRFLKKNYWNWKYMILDTLLFCICLPTVGCLSVHLSPSICLFVYLLVWWIVCLLVCLSNLLLFNLSCCHIFCFFSLIFFVLSCCFLWWLGCLKCHSHIKHSVFCISRGHFLQHCL